MPMNRVVGALRKNRIIDTIFTAQGNELSCILTEPLWGIPYNLYMPYVSMYMAALGMSAWQIGITQTVFLASQVVFAILSGVLTDKLGRRMCTLIFDCVSWSIPTLLWSLAQGYEWFLVAAVFNGAWRVTENSWNLLFIEDSHEERLVRLFSIANIAGLLAGFVAPLAYGFVQRYGVAPTMRVIYFITFVMMTAKFVILYFTSRETALGKRRMAETKDLSIIRHLWSGRKVALEMLRSRRIMLTVGLLACYMTMRSVQDSFWSLLVINQLDIPEENLSVFATVKALLMLICFFAIVPHIRAERFKRPALLSFLLLMGNQLLAALLMPGKAVFPLLIVGTVMEAVALSILAPLMTTLQTLALPANERARMQGIFFTICLLITSPFGMIGGALSDVNRRLPMALNAVLLVLSCVIALRLDRENSRAAGGFAATNG